MTMDITPEQLQMEVTLDTFQCTSLSSKNWNEVVWSFLLMFFLHTIQTCSFTAFSISPHDLWCICYPPQCMTFISVINALANTTCIVKCACKTYTQTFYIKTICYKQQLEYCKESLLREVTLIISTKNTYLVENNLCWKMSI